MSNMIPALIGFSCLTPGISIATIGGVGVQPILPLLALYWLAFPLWALRIPFQPMVWVIANVSGLTVASVFAASSAAGASYTAFQSVYFAAAGLGFGTLLIFPQHRLAFVQGYLVAALVSSAVGLTQAIYSRTTGFPLILTNNVNFSIDSSFGGRAVAFTSEASVLAGLLLPALTCIWVERNNQASLIAAPLRGAAAFLLVCAGLLATRSFTLFAAPAVLVATGFLVYRDGRAFFGSARRVLLVAGVAGVIFLPLYQARVEDQNSAGFSQAWRILKIETGLQIFQENPVIGIGPGYVSDPDRFRSHMIVPRQLAWVRDPKKGIDSTPVRILAETGILGFVLTYYPLLVFWRRAGALACRLEYRPLYSMCLPLLFTQTVALGYRDLIILLLPSIAFAVAGDVQLRPGLSPRPMGVAQSSGAQNSA